ncbi:hypothetical protein NOVO_08410 [Rickettsiales bacterium Ac37b]|nr:hypothetical protein NOVO_08410 [Rickettsiales bacterium Ac37b]
MSAEVLNAKIRAWYDKPPFYKFTKVGVFEYNESMNNKFVRFYNVESSCVKGQFIALRKDVADKEWFRCDGFRKWHKNIFSL